MRRSRRAWRPSLAAVLLVATALVACDGESGPEASEEIPEPTATTTSRPGSPETTVPATTAAQVTTTAFADLPQPQVVDSGLSYTKDGDFLTWAVVIEIPAAAPAATLFYEVDLVDNANRILDSKRESAGVVSPGETTAVAGVISQPVEGIVSLDVRSSLQDPEPDAPTGEWTLSEVSSGVENGVAEVTGFVSHTFSIDIEDVRITNVYYRDGQIVGGDYGPVARVPSGREARFDLASIAAPEFDEVRQFVMGYRSPSDTATIATEGPQPQVIDSGLSYTESGTFVSWAALIEIPAEVPTPAGLQVDVEFLDEQDRILESTRTSSSVVFPGETAAVGGLYPATVGGITGMDAMPRLGLSQSDETVGQWTITETTHQIDEYGPITTGFISHTFPDDKVNLLVTQVFYRDGKIVGGDMGPIERVPAGRGVRFELRSIEVVDFDRVELFVWSCQSG